MNPRFIIPLLLAVLALFILHPVPVPAIPSGYLYSNYTADSDTGGLTGGYWSFFAGTSVTYGSLNYLTTDSFPLTTSSTLSGLLADVRVPTGDTPSAVNVSIGSSQFDTSYLNAFPETINSSNSQFVTTVASLDIYQISLTLPGVTLGPGTYWLTFSGGAESGNIDIFWDQSSGASSAYQEGLAPATGANLLGPTPRGSESFALYGPVPEPTTMLLLGSGLIGLAGYGRKKLFKK